MNISGINSMTTTYVPRNRQKVSPSFAQEQSIAKTSSPNTKMDIYKQIAQDYDVRNASFDEFCEITDKLYDKGEISGIEHALVTLDIRPLQKTYPNCRYYLTKADQNGKRDWIAELEARVQQDEKIGNAPQGILAHKRLVDVLMHLQRK
ncbi:MAG: hypothetical protein PHI90_09085 [Clostridia bacterium]|nr:hypothetical protein [Clostridia bacterium]